MDETSRKPPVAQASSLRPTVAHANERKLEACATDQSPTPAPTNNNTDGAPNVGAASAPRPLDVPAPVTPNNRGTEAAPTLVVVPPTIPPPPSPAPPADHRPKPITLAALGVPVTTTNQPSASLPVPSIPPTTHAILPPVSSIRLRLTEQRPGTESLLPFRPIAVPEADAGTSSLPELAAQPIYVEPLFATEAEWRDWQLARQRATTKTRQAERDNLTDGLQRFLQQGARVPQ